MFSMIKRKVKTYIEKLKFNYAIIKYKIPKTCKVFPSKNISRLKCEGCNMIGKNVIAHGCELGYGSGISKDSILYNTKIGRYTVMAFGLKVIVGTHPTRKIASVHPAFYNPAKRYGFSYVSEMKFKESTTVRNTDYNLIIGNDVWIGANVLVISGVEIADGAIIAAGSVVTKNVPPFAIVGGVPAKIIRYRYTEEQTQDLLRMKWWNKDEEWIKEHAIYFVDVQELIDTWKKEFLK